MARHKRVSETNCNNNTFYVKSSKNNTFYDKSSKKSKQC